MLVLTRHFPTVDDLDGLFSDPSQEVDLAEIDEGRLSRVRRSLGVILADRGRQTALHTSARERSVRTGQLLVGTSLDPSQVFVDARLNNIAHPEWNGLTRDDVEGTDLYRRWHADPASVEFPGGESFRDLKCRADRFLTSLNPSCDHIIVGHSASLQVLTCLIMGISPEHMWSIFFDNYSVSVFLGRVLLRHNWDGWEPVNSGGLHE